MALYGSEKRGIWNAKRNVWHFAGCTLGACRLVGKLSQKSQRCAENHLFQWDMSGSQAYYTVTHAPEGYIGGKHARNG